MRSCDSVRKAIERVFGILKKRFRILKIPLPCYNLSQIVDIVHSCCILHNMILEDKDRINIGHLVDDWIDKGPDASKARRTLYDKANGRAYLLNGRAYMINNKTDYMLRGKQSKLPDWCDATGSAVRTQRCDGYAGTRHILFSMFEKRGGFARTSNFRKAVFDWLFPNKQGTVTRAQHVQEDLCALWLAQERRDRVCALLRGAGSLQCCEARQRFAVQVHHRSRRFQGNRLRIMDEF